MNKRNILVLVRDRDSLSQTAIDELMAPENIRTTSRGLIDLKRDVEAQFVAHDARMAEMRASCARAEREGGTLVSVIVGTEETEEGKTDIWEDRPPAEALDIFTGRELRWKVRTQRFYNLIENALEDVQERLTDDTERQLQEVIDAVETHRQELEGDVGEVDQDLYAVVERLKSLEA